MGEYTKPVCRGSWALGTACGRCERCEETRPNPPMIDREELERLREAADREEDDANYYGGPPSKHLPHGAALWSYLRNAVPDILNLLTERGTLAAENAALTAKVERLMNSLEPFAQLSRRKANFVIRPDDPILLEAVRALES